MAGPISEYLRKHALVRAQVATSPRPDLAMVVVMPCHDEPSALDALRSVAACQPPAGTVEVLMVVNGSITDAPEVRHRNQETALAARRWARRLDQEWLSVEVLESLDLEPRHAGVGLARKLGMDEAAARLERVGAPHGVIVGLDSDCTVSPRYLTETWEWFAAHSRAPGASIHFEHRFEDLADARHRLGIVGYELHLRAHVLGLRLAGYPHAFQTVGSSMAVRASTYARVGGMNRRKAGEDFYFLQKVIALGGFGEIRSATVFPSPRVSHRVPFGTGRAMADWLASTESEPLAYHPTVYRDLGLVLEGVVTRWNEVEALDLETFPAMARAFLVAEGLSEAHLEIRANVASEESYRRRVLAWLNPFRVLKLIHHLTRVAYPKVGVTRAATELLAWGGIAEPNPLDAESLLRLFRALDTSKS